MAKIYNWINRDGVTVFRGAEAVSRTNINKLRAIILSDESHMRVGKFAVIIGLDADGKEDVIAAPVYETIGNTHLPEKPSKFFDIRKPDRLSQIARIEQFVVASPGHPMKDEIMGEIAFERAYFA